MLIFQMNTGIYKNKIIQPDYQSRHSEFKPQKPLVTQRKWYKGTVSLSARQPPTQP